MSAGLCALRTGKIRGIFRKMSSLIFSEIPPDLLIARELAIDATELAGTHLFFTQKRLCRDGSRG